ncbi:MAG: hypothetical protein CMI34_00080 [Opitutales bacterium]|nr:hypothetical protein [Opitutales bacterium]|tara:strand:+ start:7169 stop:7540 length:372 start_codon:yes stop_codon:yes gene_type:complete
MFYENNLKSKLTLYKMSFEDNKKWQVDFDWEWSGGFVMKNNTYFFVNANGKKKFPDQDEEITVSEVKDLKEVATFAANIAIGPQTPWLTDEKVAQYKTWGYDLIKEFTNNEGIQKAADEWITK